MNVKKSTTVRVLKNVFRSAIHLTPCYVPHITTAEQGWCITKDEYLMFFQMFLEL